MFITIKNTVNLFRAGFHYVKMDSYENEILAEDFINNIGGYDYIEVVHTGFVLGSLARLACLYVKRCGDKFIPVVVTEKRMKDFSFNVHLFTILHEIGHFELHVNKETGNELEFITEPDVNIEHQADCFAARIMGIENAIIAIDELYKSDLSDNHQIRIQLFKRMKLLKEIIWEGYENEN